MRVKPRLLLPIAGAVLWLAGVATGVSGRTLPGAELRVAAILVAVWSASRRPSLSVWTFLSLFIGTELGLDAPRLALQLHVLADLFLRLIRMLVAPLLFATITTGIASHGHLRSIGRVAIKAFVYFEIVTTLGLLIGSAAMNLAGVGWGIPVPPETAALASVAHPETWQQIVLNLFPENIAQAVAQAQILQIAVFSFMFGLALALLPEPRRVPLTAVLRALADTMFQLTRFVMYLAPVAAGAAIAYTVASTGAKTLLPLGKLVLTYYAALAVFCLLVFLPILLLYRIPIGRFIRAVREPAAIGFATTASESVLPLAMESMEQFGVPRWIASFVIPTGYSFNMDGASVYLSMAAVFAAQAAGIHLRLGQQIMMLGVLMLASKGIAGVPRAVLVVLLATAASLRIPTAPILLILGVDTLMDMGRTAINIIGNCLASAVVARSEEELAEVPQTAG